MDEQFLTKLVQCDSVASREDQIRTLLYEELSTYCDEVIYDQLGSIAFHKKGNGPNVMLCAHMDEVGFLIKNITHNGMLELILLGSVQPLSQYMQRVHIVNAENETFNGVLMCDGIEHGLAIHPYVNMGCTSKEDVLKLGIQVGDMVSFASEPMRMNSMFVSKALDDRIGCYVLAQVLKELSTTTLDCNLYIVYTSSEEVGTRGAQTITNKINPDIGIAVDIGSAKDVHKTSDDNHRRLGSGPMLLHYDKGFIPTQRMTKYIQKLADECNVSLQHDMFVGGGTDMDKVHISGDGKPGVTLGIPLHYAHGAYSFVHERDVEDMQQLCKAFVKGFNQATYQSLITFIGKI